MRKWTVCWNSVCLIDSDWIYIEHRFTYSVTHTVVERFVPIHFNNDNTHTPWESVDPITYFIYTLSTSSEYLNDIY